MPWRAITVGLLLLSLVLTGMAIWLAAIAAQGTAELIPGDAAGYYQWATKEMWAVRERIRTSRQGTIIAFVALLGGVLLLLFVPKTTELKYMVRPPGAVAVCGVLEQGAHAGEVQLRTTGNAILALTSDMQLTSVTDCP
jgi:hypothetical protein